MTEEPFWTAMPEHMWIDVLRADGVSRVLHARQLCVSSSDPAVPEGSERWAAVPIRVEIAERPGDVSLPACAGCKYAKRSGKGNVWRNSHCEHPTAALPSWRDIFGGRTNEGSHCTVWRMRLGGGGCGEEARYFEPRPPDAEEVKPVKEKAPTRGRRRPAGFVREPRWKFGAMDVGQPLTARGGIDAPALRAAANAYRKKHPGWDYRTMRAWEGDIVVQTVVRVS